MTTFIGHRTGRFFSAEAQAKLKGGGTPRCYVFDAGRETAGLVGPQVAFILFCACDFVSLYEEVVLGDIDAVDANALIESMAAALIANATEKLTALGVPDPAGKKIHCFYCLGDTTIVAGFPFTPSSQIFKGVQSGRDD